MGEYYQREEEKEAAGRLFREFIRNHLTGFWKPYAEMVALQSRANLEIYLQILRGEPPKHLDEIAAELRGRGEDPTEWRILVILNAKPPTPPPGQEFPDSISSEDGSVTCWIHVETVEGYKFVT